MKLYTRTGDSGETSLFDGTRVRKDDLRVTAYGEVDGLSSVLGWCACAARVGTFPFEDLQRNLFVLGAELATPPDSPQATRIPLLTAADGTRLESWIDEAAARLEPLRHFVLPGGTELSARLHICRCACRRAEREVVRLGEGQIRPEVIIYLNRLSDLLFVWARLANAEAGVSDVLWKPRP